MSLIQADAQAIPLAAGTVQCVVTSPPYWGLRDYGVAGQLGLERTPEEYVERMVGVFREVRRVLRDDGVVWMNLGDSYLAQQGKGMPGKGGVDNRNTAADPSIMRLCKRPDWLKPKDLVGQPWRVAFALQADGWYLRSDIIWAKPNPMPESVTDRPTRSHEYVFLLSKRARYFYDADAVREDAEYGRRIWTRQQFKGGDLTKSHGKDGGSTLGGDPSAGRNARTVWTIPTQPYPEAHYATFPEALAKRCILAGSRSGDLVLDPFVGSGTVVKVARNLARRGVGLDISAEYLHGQASRRIKTQMGLAL